MVTITLPPELEEVIIEQANRQGTTPELWALDMLRQSLQPEAPAEPVQVQNLGSGTMLDFFNGYVGVLHSSEKIQGGAQMSKETGRKFAEGMLKKRQEGKL